MTDEGFSVINLERSARLHAFMRDLVAQVGDGVPPKRNLQFTANKKDFTQKLSRSRLFTITDTKLEQAYHFALGTTKGRGGDEFQHFMAGNLAWSQLKTAAAEAATLQTYADWFKEVFTLELTGVLVPVHSPTLDGLALLLFLWHEDDLAPSSVAIQKVFLACLVRIENADIALAGVREALKADEGAPQSVFCELLPRPWLLAEAPSRSVALIDEMALTFAQVAKLGELARCRFITHAVVDGNLFANIDAEVDTIEKERAAAAETAKKKRKKRNH